MPCCYDRKMENKIRKQDILHKKNEFKNMRDLVEWSAVTYYDRVGYSYRVRPLDKDAVRKTYVEKIGRAHV